MNDGRIRVLFAMFHMGMGGSERLVYNLIRNIDRHVFEPSVAWFVQERPLDEFKALDIPLHYCAKRRRIDPGAMQRLASVVSANRIDVVNAHHFMPFIYSYYGSRVANRARLVYTEHSEADVLAARGKWQTIGGLLLRRTDGIVGVSERVSGALRSHFGLPAGRVQTIENGVDTELFSARPKTRDRLRAQLGLSPDDVVIGHVANFRRNKNHLFLLRAFRDLAARRPAVKLVFIGKGYDGDPENSEPDAMQFIESHGLSSMVHRLGYQSNVEDQLQILDLACLVSYKEGLPLSLIETMATRLPVVGTDIEGIRTVVTPEVNGLLVAPDDVAGLTNALDRLACDGALRQRMGERGRQLATERYSLKRCIEQTEGVFRSLMSSEWQRWQAQRQTSPTLQHRPHHD